jgi:hypothetical protein
VGFCSGYHHGYRCRSLPIVLTQQNPREIKKNQKRSGR